MKSTPFGWSSGQQPSAPASATPPAGPADQAIGPSQRLRWSLHGVLLAVALLLAAAGWSAWQSESHRSSDTRLINLAGAQRMLSQRVALLAGHPAADDGESLKAVLERARGEAQHIETLLGMADRKQRAELPGGVVFAALQWKAARERLWTHARDPALAVNGDRDPAAAARATALLRADADVALGAAQDLVSELQQFADAKSAVALHRLMVLFECGGALLLVLGLGVVEPATRYLRRQHERLAVQSAQIERLALVAEHTREVVLITDAQRRIVWTNDAFTRLCGFSREEALGRKPSELVQAPETDPATIARVRAALDAGSGVQAELLNRAKDGRLYWLDVDIQPLHDRQGRLSGFIAAEMEITEAVTQRARRRALCDALHTGVLEQDTTGTIIYANRAAEQILGLSYEQLLGRTSVDERWRAVREDLSAYPAELRPMHRSLRNGESVRNDAMGVVTPLGEQRWLMVNSEPLRDPAGAVAGVVASFVDVTEQRAQRSLLQFALEAGRIGTWVWRVDSNEREWSEESCRMLGYSQDEFRPLLPRWRDRIHPDDRPEVDALILAHLDNPAKPYLCDLRIRHRAGHYVWVHSRGAVVERDATGSAKRMLGVYMDISEHKRQEQQLQDSAFTDALTGLPNRTALLQRLQTCIEGAAPGHFAVLLLDFDRFKQVNDMIGHAGGDELLRQVGDRLRGALRSAEGAATGVDGGQRIAARLGGDEFVVLLTGLRQPAEAGALADRLLDLLGRPYEVRGQRVHSSASIGIVDSRFPFDNAESLLRDADNAMYEAKRAGRGRWVLFESRMHEQARLRAGIQSDLHVALERGELFVVYQPVVSLDDPGCEHGCAGVEALVRWRHPERGVVPPIEFIPVAEESGLIVPLGQFVLETACHQFMRWRLDLGERAPALLAVNLSVAQLRQTDLVEQVRRVLQASAMPAAALQLEVTESLAAQDPLAQARLRELKALGVKLSLDDFGTGYSSLACLHQMPVDTVKVDRSFVIEAERSEYHRALIEATVRVARTLRMSTVAEGVETAEQAWLVATLGCDKGQGYLYSRPLEAAALENWLAERTEAAAAATPALTLWDGNT
ncbi:MAG: EAL domain-containing protein [Pseudomonadota bacterium]